ncbi:MAG: DNA-binding response regulator [Alkalinema sp. CACIAM 70d]|nr:MAG: DNA-binding response regulator [Alkalinema sp. CACIAM 70d]
MSLGRVLIIEDEELIRETVALALTEEGYEVTVASDGRTALEILQASALVGAGGSSVTYGSASQTAPREQPDLIILDLMLPNINGLDLCRLIRRQGSSVPILMLSAKGTETDRVVGLEIGADDYMTKPFGMRELVARCRALLRRQQQFQPTVPDDTLGFQSIVMYPQECRVMVKGQEVNLSPKEFKLLELFMRHPKRVWSRDQLLERIWGHDFIGDSKTVDVHIRWLREKLENDPSNPEYLVTVRGFGYRFG